MIFYIILLLIILAIVIWGGVTRWRFVNGKGKDYFENDHVIIPPVKMDFKNDVAIVGHGPISEEDRKLINKFDTVYRMSRLLNFNKGDKITHLLISDGGAHSSDKTYELLESYDAINSIKKFYVCGCIKNRTVSQDGFKQIKEHVKATRIKNGANDHSELCSCLMGANRKVPKAYPKDKLEDVSRWMYKFKIGDVEYENTPRERNFKTARATRDPAWGKSFTTGFITIAIALDKHPSSNIHLFGYSWYGFYLKKGEPAHKFYKWRPEKFAEGQLRNSSHISERDRKLGAGWPTDEGIAIIMTCDRCFIHPINSENAYA
tara:strand:+ start:148 stop:1101 length:954 start_codon:yes stop_codon:yes gene_type:complete